MRMSKHVYSCEKVKTIGGAYDLNDDGYLATNLCVEL